MKLQLMPRNSIKGALNPYQFSYSDFNPDYSQQSMDRWGNYKPKVENGVSASKNPYVNQNDKSLNDQYASAWNLSQINLPSGGVMEIEYETDDYGFVQNESPSQMMRVVDIDYDSGKVSFTYNPNQSDSIGSYLNNMTDVYFKIYNNHWLRALVPTDFARFR